MHELRRMLAYLGPYRRDALLGALAVALETSIELVIPLLMANIIDRGIVERDIPAIFTQGALMLACALVALALGLAYARFASRVATGIGANLRRAEYEKIQTFAFGNLDRFQTASLVTRLTTDITVIQNAFANGFRPLVRSPFILIMGLLYASMLNLELAGVFFVVLPLLGLALGVITFRVLPLYRTLQTAMDRLNGAVQEDLTAMRAIKAYVREDHERAVFAEANRNLAERSTTTFSNAVLNLPVHQLSMYVTATAVLWIGGNMIVAGRLTVGELTSFMSYVLQIMNSLMMISNVFLLLTRALTSMRRVAEVLDEKPQLALPDPGEAVREVADGSVEFRGVDFKYRADAEHDVLEGIDLSIPSGATVGVLGGTGSGKSSLVQLICRLYDPSAGAVLVGGRDVRCYDLPALRDAVGIVLQANVLFSGTIRDNLRWGDPEATDEELLRACELACADEFLDRIGGLDGELGQGGAGVSGGQKQRLCIARTLLKRPRVLIFDDSTSAVDMATEAKIRSNLAQIPGVTVITIAQRITSVMDADEIFVMDDGRIHAHGTHAELLANDTIYQEIYASQMEHASDGAASGEGPAPAAAEGAGEHAAAEGAAPDEPHGPVPASARGFGAPAASPAPGSPAEGGELDGR